jgi:hypothetical protein
MVFFKKNILIPNVAEKNILILVEEKKKSDSEFLSYNLMLNSATKTIKYSNSRELNGPSLIIQVQVYSVSALIYNQFPETRVRVRVRGYDC